MNQMNGANNTTPITPVIAERPIKTTRDYVKVVFRQKRFIILTVIVVTLMTYFGLKFFTPVYESEVKMLVSAEKETDAPYQRDFSIYSGNDSGQTLTQSEIVTSKPVLERAVLALGLNERPLDYENHFASPLKQKFVNWQNKQTGARLETMALQQKEGLKFYMAMEDLKSRVKVTPVRDTHLFSIVVTDFSPIAAAVTANAVSRSYVMFDLEQQYVDLQAKYTEKNPVVIQMKENIANIRKGLSGQPLPSIEAIGPASVKIIEQATPALKPVGLPRKLILLIGFVMSIFLGAFLAFSFEYLDQTFHSKQDLEVFLGAPVIACINKKKGLGDRQLVHDVSDTNKSPRAVSYRILAQQILFMVKTKNLKHMLFASVNPADDSATILSNSAVFISSRLGLRTLVIDANLRNPSLHKFFKGKVNQGLAEILEGSLKSEEAVRPVNEKLHYISAGHSVADPGILLGKESFSRILLTLSPSYDLLLINGANVRDFRDTPLIASSTDGVILIIGESTVRRQVVQYSMKHLNDNHCRILGAVMPNREYMIPKFLYESV